MYYLFKMAFRIINLSFHRLQLCFFFCQGDYPKIRLSKRINFSIIIGFNNFISFYFTQIFLFFLDYASINRVYSRKNFFSCVLLISRESYFSIRFMENEVGCHQLSARKLQSAASIRSYILEGWQSNVIYFPSNAIKAHFEVWRYEKLAVNFGLPINFLVKSTPSSSRSAILAEFCDAY